MSTVDDLASQYNEAEFAYESAARLQQECADQLEAAKRAAALLNPTSPLASSNGCMSADTTKAAAAAAARAVRNPATEIVAAATAKYQDAVARTAARKADRDAAWAALVAAS